MSLINDALKRAREAQSNEPPSAPPLPPVASGSRRRLPRHSLPATGWIIFSTSSSIL